MYDEDEGYLDERAERNQRAEDAILNRDHDLYKCPDCGNQTLTAYQRAHGYHCDGCTRNVEYSGGRFGY